MLVNREIENELYHDAGDTRVQKARLYVRTGRTKIEKINYNIAMGHRIDIYLFGDEGDISIPYNSERELEIAWDKLRFCLNKIKMEELK